MKNRLTGIVCLILALAIVFAGCGGTGDNAGSSSGSAEPSASAQSSHIQTREAVQVSGPVTVEFWHSSEGALGEKLNDQIRQFNENNGQGITVVGTYKGSYSNILEEVKKVYNTEDVPDLVVAGAGGIEELAEAGAAADMAAYVARDSFDMENIPKSMRYYSEHYDGKVIQFPYLVNASVIYYNKAFYPDGFPTTLEDWVVQAQQITGENPDVYGMALPPDTGYIQRPLIRSLGAAGFTTDNGTAPGGLEDGTMEEFLTDWCSWVNGGYCMGVTGTNALTALVSGKLAAFPASCVYNAEYADKAASAGIELGCAPNVVYGGQGGALGGAGLCVMAQSTDQQIAACWEFIKFLYEDEQAAANTVTGGVLPLTYSAAKHGEVQQFWQTYPASKAAFEHVETATYNEWSVYLVQWRSEIAAVITDVVGAGSLSPADGVSQLKRKAAVIFK